VSRLTRSVAFLSKLLATDVEIRFVDQPAIEGPTGRFLLHQIASVAEPEAGMISDRTKRPTLLRKPAALSLAVSAVAPERPKTGSASISAP
jgi:DNA invertase Pin-like site-specific DNA recombinase